MTHRTRKDIWFRLSRLLRARRMRNAAAFGLVLLGPVLAFATFLVLGPLDQGGLSLALRLVLLADMIYVIIVATLILAQIARLVAARRAKSAGSHLHLRLTAVFATVALIPTVTVAIFAGLTFNIGLEGWFSERVSRVIGASLAAAEAYEREQRLELAREARALGNVINRERYNAQAGGRPMPPDPQLLADAQTARNLREAYLIDGTGTLRARGDRSYLFDFEPPDRLQIDEARAQGIIVIEDWPNDEFRALVPMRSYVDRLLYVSRRVDGEILSLLDETRETARLYQQLESERGGILFRFGLLYLGFALILILASIWLGLWFAERLSGPVGRLTGAAQRVGTGDLDVQVREENRNDEIAILGRYFNQMTRQLKAQREALLENTRQIERRRRLFDSVLGSVTSGVIGLDADGAVTLANRSAQRLLGLHKEPQGQSLSLVVPEFAALFEALKSDHNEAVQDQVKLTRAGRSEMLLVRMSKRRRGDQSLEGYVVAFDDVTDLVSAQRMAAWADVARRIAHEIKNPLTPIQLSAERILRKFGPQVGQDRQKLETMTATIVRQTAGLRRIVDEFSHFARMPAPNRKPHDLRQIVGDMIALHRTALPEIEIVEDLPDAPIWGDVDETMIGQVLTNLIKNAGEAIALRRKADIRKDHAPRIEVKLTRQQDMAQLWIVDNGIGLPKDRARLFEPYVTTRDDGTGLGLPIVRKIVEDHGGTLKLEDAPASGENGAQGACAIVTLPVMEKPVKVEPIEA